RVPGAAQAFGVRSTPTFVVLANPVRPPSKRARRRAAQASPAPAASTGPTLNPRWRVTGMVRKDILAGALNSNGAKAAGVTSKP
ncbi:MAG TPA: hypothetical protein VFY15_02680, partial [Acidimicrobiia bacterium]|nr:hypothetical protein [Acidimicrobiia bacterium]